MRGYLPRKFLKFLSYLGFKRVGHLVRVVKRDIFVKN